MEKVEVLNLIEKISPHAKLYVKNGFEKESVQVIYASPNNNGIFICVDNDDCCIFYTIFVNESDIKKSLPIIECKINEYISKGLSKEVCFNVYGENIEIIKLVRNLGFQLDIEGYHLEYQNKEILNLEEGELIEKKFEENMVDSFIKLFDSAYYKLNLENNWELNNHLKNKEYFERKLIELSKLNAVSSFWLNNELIGAYIFEDNYITDIVVEPLFQNKGYGSYILKKCIENMRENNSIKDIRLRVAKSNVGAKKLYELNGFNEIAYFSEHTYENYQGNSLKA